MEQIQGAGKEHITRKDYDLDRLVRTILFIKEKYHVDVYMEPGEAVALNTGYLVASVLDVVNNGMDIAILDTSAACHMPDVLEMPYRPRIIGAGYPGEFCDMAHYTMVKNNMFNGVNLPCIALFSEEEGVRILKRFGYSDYKSRL